MRSRNRSLAAIVVAITVAIPAAVRAQHEGHMHPPQPAPADTAKAASPAMDHTHEHAHMHAAAPPGMDHAHELGHMHAPMPAFYGSYPFTREASGTAWQPESTPHEGRHLTRGGWSLMLHGFAFAIAGRQGGPRGDDRLFSTNMVMARATHPLGPGRFGMRAMVALEPLTVGRHGYPLLLQTGETADGVTHLIDRQHPHDLFMELAGTWSVSDERGSAFVYLGLPGEPALGPPAFMHRPSGEADPESPIGHHWLDSSHITFGVATVGLARGAARLEASAFRGREPDQDRWNIERPKLDSHSFRLSVNPAPDWSLQASRGRIESPEQLDPDTDVDRRTASLMWSHEGLSALAAWGQNRSKDRPTLDAMLLEGAGVAGRHTVFARAERVEKNELFPAGDPRSGQVFTVGRLSAGYVLELREFGPLGAGIGAMGGIALVPADLKSVYGHTPLSASLFVRARLR